MSNEKRESSKRFRIFAIVLLVIGGAFIAFFMAIRLNPSLYRKLFMHATSKTPAELNPNLPSGKGLEYSSSDNPEFNSFISEVEPILLSYKDDIKPEYKDVYETNLNKLNNFTLTSLSKEQRATYDQLKSYLSTRFKLASANNDRDHYSALLNSYTLGDKSTDYYNELLDVYIEYFFSDAQSLTSKNRGLTQKMEKSSFPNKSSEELVSIFNAKYPVSTPVSDLRLALANKSYTEGLSKYAEYSAYGLVGGEDEKIVNLRRDYNEIITCLYAKADIMANYYGNSKDEISNYLTGYGIRNADKQTDFYNHVLNNPGDYASTGIGFLEYTDLARKAKLLKGDNFKVDDFNNFIVNVGPLSYEDIETRLST